MCLNTLEKLKRIQIKRKEAEAIILEAKKRKLTSTIGKVKRAEILKVYPLFLLVVNDAPFILFDVSRETTVPFISSIGKYSICPSITVDMGAVPYIVKGADVMAPGVNAFEEFEVGDITCVKTERYSQTIATGIALISSKDIGGLRKGKTIKNVHYIGDRYWNSAKKLSFRSNL